MVCVTHHGIPFIRVTFAEHSLEQVCPLSLVCYSQPILAGPSLRLEIQRHGRMCVRPGRWSRLRSSRLGLSCSWRDYGRFGHPEDYILTSSKSQTRRTIKLTINASGTRGRSSVEKGSIWVGCEWVPLRLAELYVSCLMLFDPRSSSGGIRMHEPCMLKP